MKKLLALLLACLMTAAPALAAPTFVNAANKSGGTTGTNGAVITATAGDAVLVFVAFDNNQGNNPHVCTTADAGAPCNSLNGVTDAQGNTYTKLGVIQPNNSTCNGTGGSTACVFMEVWYTLSLASSTSDTITVTSTPTGAGTAPAIEFMQYGSVGAINLTNFVSGSGTSATSGTLTITTTQGGDIVVGSFGDNPTNTQSVNGCNARGTAVSNVSNTVNIKTCDNTSVLAGNATSVGMTFGSATWAGMAVELCTSSPCPAGGVNNNVVIIN